jgi:hypothetical protein
LTNAQIEEKAQSAEDARKEAGYEMGFKRRVAKAIRAQRREYW